MCHRNVCIFWQNGQSQRRIGSVNELDQQDGLFERVGGQNRIGEMVEDFYSNIMKDDSLSSFFQNIDMDKQKNHQTHFLSFVMGGPNQYSGRTLAKAHEGVNATGEHFDSIIGHLQTTMEKHQMSKEEIDSVLKSIAQYKRDIVSE